MEALARLGLTGCRVLIVHHDDLGMTHAQNQAHTALEAFPTGSVMLPTAWATEWAGRAHPDLGVHLTLTSEWAFPRWRPLTRGPSLRDAHGYFWPTVQQAWQAIRADEAEAEMRAQIEAALTLGLDVTHLDTHMGSALRPDLAAIYVRLAQEYDLAALLPTAGFLRQLRLPAEYLGPVGDVIAGAGLPQITVVDGYIVPPEQRRDWYLQVLRELGPGLYQFTHHAALPTPEGQALPDWQGRQADFDLLRDPEIQAVLAAFVPFSYRQLRDRWRASATARQPRPPQPAE